jgi:hypothetical protein
VCACEDHDVLFGDGVDEAVREASQQDAPHPWTDLRMLQGTPLDGSDGGVEGAEEFSGQSGATGLVPLRGLDDLPFGFRSVEEPTAHAPKRALSRARTSPCGDAEEGSCS